MENSSSFNLIDRFNQWIKESITVKLLSIGFLVIILLIPTAWIINLMEERQERAELVITEVSNKWSGDQTLSGPILVVPYTFRETVKVNNETIDVKESTKTAYFLPEILEIKGTVNPEILSRGIFDVAVYESSLQMNAKFTKPDFKKLEISPEMVLWKDAYMIVAISDLRGISKTPPQITSGSQSFTAEPAQNVGISIRKLVRQINERASNSSEHTAVSSTGIIVPLNMNTEQGMLSEIEINFNLKGSNSLNFIPSGKTTSVKLNGTWTDPSFDGEFLPTNREITSAGFTADWDILHFNRPISQQWKESDLKLTGSEFGLKLLVPVDQYQKSIRTSKYGILVILLTFIALFLVEITSKIRIHPFQYILIGAALIIYYTLLMSLSEHVGYTIAYWIATLSTVALVSSYSVSFFKNKKLVWLFTSLLIVFYSFVYIIILQQDFSLLIGSVGLFLIVGALMYFSRKVNWYGDPDVSVN